MAEKQRRTVSQPRAKTIKKTGVNFDESRYEFDDRFNHNRAVDFNSAKTIYDVVEVLEKDTKKTIEVDARILNYDGKAFTPIRMNRTKFLEAFKKNEAAYSKFKEADNFGFVDGALGVPGMVGQDFIPLIGGPFNKQLYLYDALKQFQTCFHAYHHDPLARRIVNIMVDFTLGRGFRVDCKNPEALAQWNAFAKANRLPEQMEHCARELSIYGEVMWWKLPNYQTKMEFGPEAALVPKGLIPRVRLMDPSTCWEIITMPTDIENKIAFQFIFPTQYQMYTAEYQGKQVPSFKFVVQQIPAEQINQYKVNITSNEKRGRSDLFPALGYLKRIRDLSNYSMIAALKSAAWSIDTTVMGSQSDIDAYVAEQESLGTIAPAGSEFVHTDKIKREYLSNSAVGKGGDDQAYTWNLNMVSIATGIPVSYLGTHLSGGSTRASAIVGTEPVAKVFDARQLVLERIIQDMWKYVINDCLGMKDDCEVTFPDIMTKDSSQKIKDITLAQQSHFISLERAASMVAKELNITDFDFASEKAKIEEEMAEDPELLQPLTQPPMSQGEPQDEGSFDNGDKKKVSDNDGF